MGRVKSFLYGFTVGGVAAGITVLLNTPKSGSHLRHDIKEKWSDLNTSVDDIKIAVSRARSNINDLATRGLPLVKSTINDVKGLVETYRKDIQPQLGRILQDTKQLSEETNRIALTNTPNEEKHFND